MIDCNCEVWTAENEVEFFSNACTTTSASPLMLAYLDSADEVHRLPNRVTFQPEWQQGGFVGVQLQCFCRSQKPMPSLLKSVARRVGLLLSNISTPFCISCTIMITLVASKRVSSLSVHLNTEFGFRWLRKGFLNIVKQIYLPIYWLSVPTDLFCTAATEESTSIYVLLNSLKPRIFIQMFQMVIKGHENP